MCVFFLFKQKTAYEMRISDWSSDVCSSDLEVAMSPPLASLRWPSRPALPAGATGWVSETIHTPQGEFAVAVADHDSVPFEVWVLGGQPPRGLDAIAKTLDRKSVG